MSRVDGRRYVSLANNDHVELVSLETSVKGELHSHLYVRPLKPNVLVAPYTVDGELVLVKHFRPSINEWFWEFPGGAIENGESELDAARRELLEETGYASSIWSCLMQGYDRAGIVANTLSLYMCCNAVQVQDREKDSYIGDVALVLPKNVKDLPGLKMGYVELVSRFMR